MPPIALYFVHGWGYDHSFWKRLCDQFINHPCYFYEAGYFNKPRNITPPTFPYLAIGHSAGVMKILCQNDPFCLGFIAFNGFACFTQNPSFPKGIPSRVLQRMIRRLEQDPLATLTQFRTLCGEERPEFPETYDKSSLKSGLEFLQNTDARPLLSHWDKPVINIMGTCDPLSPSHSGLPSSTPHCLRENHYWEGGHLLPVTHALQSAQLIRDVLRDKKLCHSGALPS